jgi:hypothetical protein
MKRKELTFKEVVARIKANIRRKDIMPICAAAELSSTTPFYNACKKKDWNKLSPAQLAVIDEALSLVKKREQERKEMLEKLEEL